MLDVKVTMQLQLMFLRCFKIAHNIKWNHSQANRWGRIRSEMTNVCPLPTQLFRGLFPFIRFISIFWQILDGFLDRNRAFIVFCDLRRRKRLRLTEDRISWSFSATAVLRMHWMEHTCTYSWEDRLQRSHFSPLCVLEVDRFLACNEIEHFCQLYFCRANSKKSCHRFSRQMNTESHTLFIYAVAQEDIQGVLVAVEGEVDDKRVVESAECPGKPLVFALPFIFLTLKWVTLVFGCRRLYPSARGWCSLPSWCRCCPCACRHRVGPKMLEVSLQWRISYQDMTVVQPRS